MPLAAVELDDQVVLGLDEVQPMAAVPLDNDLAHWNRKSVAAKKPDEHTLELALGHRLLFAPYIQELAKKCSTRDAMTGPEGEHGC